MEAEPLDRPVFIGGTGSDGAAALAAALSEHPNLEASIQRRALHVTRTASDALIRTSST